MGKPIETARYRALSQDPAVLQRVRSRVARSLDQLIAELRERRARNTGQGILRRMLNRL